MLLVNTGIRKIVNAHSVGKTDSLSVLGVGHGEVIVVVVTAESTLQAVIEADLKQIVLVQTAENAVCSLTVLFAVGFASDAVVIFHVCGRFNLIILSVAVMLHNFRPSLAIFDKRNMEERQVFDGFIFVAVIDVSLLQLLHFGGVPINLLLVDVVIFPRHSEVVALDIAVAVKGDNSLCNLALCDGILILVFDIGLFHLDNIVAVAVSLACDSAALEQTIFKVAASYFGFVILADILTCIHTVSLGIVIAEGKRPVNAESLHQIGKNLCCA